MLFSTLYNTSYRVRYTKVQFGNSGPPIPDIYDILILIYIIRVLVPESARHPEVKNILKRARKGRYTVPYYTGIIYCIYNISSILYSILIYSIRYEYTVLYSTR